MTLIQDILERDLSQKIAEIIKVNQADENIDIWISGFFRSGKSSFAKILGYILKNPPIRGTNASTLFKEQIKDVRASQYLDFINAGIPTDVIMFDISTDRLVKHGGLEPMKFWKELEEEKYDWSCTAMRYWPEQVRTACKRNKSYAIAHGLEEEYEECTYAI